MGKTDIEEPVLDERSLDCLLAALPTVPLSPQRRAALKAHVLREARSAHAGFDIVLASDGTWLPLRPGVWVKPFRVDSASRSHTSLWRLDPGAELHPHTHSQEEECLVIDGSIVWDGQRHDRGTFLLSHAGTRHSMMTSPEGALLLIRGELSEELGAVLSQARSS